MKRLFSLLIVAFFGISAALAQDADVMKIEIRDGRVFVDGKDLGPTDAERIQITSEDGEIVHIRIGENGSYVWVGDEDDPTRLFERLQGHGFRFRGDGHIGFADPEDHPRVFFQDGGSKLLRDLGSSYERMLDNVHGELGAASDYLGALRLRPGFNPEILTMERRIAEKARQVRRASGDERAELELELDGLLPEAFELRLQTQRQETEELRERLDERQTRLEERRRSRDEIIARKKRDLLGERDLLDW